MPKKPRGKRRPAKVRFRRRDEKFAGLHKEFHPKTRWEYIDMDYINQLSDADKEFLSKVIDEYYGASLAPSGEPERWAEDFHDTPDLRKECMDRNNARNRDIYTILRTRGWVEAIDGQIHAIDANSFPNPDNHEDVINELLDLSAEKQVSESSLIVQAAAPQPKDPQEPQE